MPACCAGRTRSTWIAAPAGAVRFPGDRAWAGARRRVRVVSPQVRRARREPVRSAGSWAARPRAASGSQ
ncbi:hypothetical protein AE618_21490 [Bosea vaviloviae]|uniref:Uncharacterized protein n=1 Tax=Bosea vaviloviae TaxID=1526658 RepID=A0A0N0M9M7_9HYPH|nr:hypothetical protein AE618_21490 [Bosea vaviloviae]